MHREKFAREIGSAGLFKLYLISQHGGYRKAFNRVGYFSLPAIYYEKTIMCIDLRVVDDDLSCTTVRRKR